VISRDEYRLFVGDKEPAGIEKECTSGVSDGVFRQGKGKVRQRRGWCRGAYEEFFTATVNEYDDLKYIRREIEENLLRRRHYA